MTHMHAYITAFKVMRGLWEAHLANGQFVHFLHLAARVSGDVDLHNCVRQGTLRFRRRSPGSKGQGRKLPRIVLRIC